MNKQRNISLDIAKAVCTFMVVFLHAGENNAIETYIKIICTCAVPFFFLVSGYYLSLNVTAGKTDYVSRQLKKIGELFIIFQMELIHFLIELKDFSVSPQLVMFNLFQLILFLAITIILIIIISIITI